MERLIHFRNRDDVIKFAMGHIPKSYRSIARSFEEGEVEFLGGFKCRVILGWIIKTTSKFGNIYYLFIHFNCFSRLQLTVLDKLEWQCWDGDKSDNPLYQGDHPEKYRELKENAGKRKAN